jgi:hypothetical protein
MKCNICHENLDGGLFGLWGRCINPHCFKNHHHDHQNIAAVKHTPDGKTSGYIIEDTILSGTIPVSHELSARWEPCMMSECLSGVYNPIGLEKAGQIYAPYIPFITVEHLLNKQLEINKLKNKEIV